MMASIVTPGLVGFWWRHREKCCLAWDPPKMPGSCDGERFDRSTVGRGANADNEGGFENATIIRAELDFHTLKLPPDLALGARILREHISASNADQRFNLEPGTARQFATGAKEQVAMMMGWRLNAGVYDPYPDFGEAPESAWPAEAPAGYRAMQVFGRAVLEGRAARKWSLKDMGKQVGRSYETVRQWERGDLAPTLKDVVRVALAFDATFCVGKDGALTVEASD